MQFNDLPAYPGVLTLSDAAVLMSWWKPLLMLLPFLPWAWLVSRVFDKHAARFYLPRPAWNLGHLSAGLLALLAIIAMPMRSEAAFWAGFGVAVLILAADVAIFVLVTNRDERVPAEHRLKLDFSSLTEARQKKAAAKKQGTVELVIKGADKTLIAAPDAETPDFQTRVAAESVLIKAFSSRASQAEVIPTGKDNAYIVQYLVDGVRVNGDQLAGADALKAMDFWKAAAKLDLSDRRKKLVGDIEVTRGESKKKVRVTSLGTPAGMKLSMLFDPEAAVRRKPDDMGLLSNQAEELKKLVEDGRGVVILAGPLDSGRTTTLYTFTKMHDSYTKNVHTVEIDVQDSLEGVRQNKWEATPDGPDFWTFLRSILRRDPEVVSVAEVPDPKTAQQICEGDMERTRFYVSLRADSAISALQQWLKAVGDPEKATKALKGVVAQKLVRKLCTNCRSPYQPPAEMLKKLGLPADKVKQLFKKGGRVLIKNKEEICPACGGVGYIGQEGVFEIFPIDQAERAAIKAGDWNALKVEFRKRKLPNIQEAALRKALDGVTSVEEIGRITSEGLPAQAAAAPAKPAQAPAPAKA